MLSDKKLAKIEKVLGADIISELAGLSPVAAKEKLVHAEKAMKQAREELEVNPKYQELKENLKALSAGLKEVNKYQKAVIEYVLHLLEAQGK